MNTKKKDKDKVRSSVVLIAVTEKEYKEILALAEEDKTSLKSNGKPNLSRFCRNIVLSSLSLQFDERILRELKQLNYQIRKIGVNVNQIAKKMNEGIGKDADIKNLLERMAEIEGHFEDLEDSFSDNF